MATVSDWALKFIRWGMGLTVFALITGYFPLAHYLMKDSLPSCPAAPVHGHAILLSFVGMTLFGLVYRSLPAWSNGSNAPLGRIRAHFWLAVIGTIGVAVNGTIGYEILNHLGRPDFYYIGLEGQGARNLWFALDGLFLTVYAAGCVMLLHVLMTSTAYGRSEIAQRNVPLP